MSDCTPLPMNSDPQALVVGIGSPHGDDKAGWEVVDRLLDERVPTTTPPLTTVGASIVECRPLRLLDASHVELRKASVPHDLLDWLEADRETHIVDASIDSHAAVRRFEVCSDDAGLQFALKCHGEPEQDQLPQCDLNLSQLRSNSTHRIGLLEVLQLSRELGRLPRQLTLWTVTTEVSKTGGYGISKPAEQRISECAQLLRKALGCWPDTH